MIYLKSSVGIEIRGDDLLISCLQSNYSTAVFARFQRIAGYRTREKQEVQKEIDTYFKAQHLGRDNVVLGLPRSDIVLRHLDLPAEVADNLKQVIPYQVQAFEPTEEERFYFDYISLKTAPDAKRLLVLLVMIKKAVLDGYLEVLRGLGIRPAMVICNSIALTNLFLQNGRSQEKKTYILADLMPGGVEVIAVKDGALQYSRAISREGSAGWKDLLLREIEAAAAKIRLGPDDVIENVVLSGESAKEALPELKESIEECGLMGKQVRFETPVTNHADLEEAAASLGLAYSGLVQRPAMRLNLLPAGMRVQMTRWSYVPTVLLGLSILILLTGMALRQGIQERILISRLDKESDNLKTRVAKVQSVINEAEALEKKIAYREGLMRNRDMNLQILKELTALLPTDTYLNVYLNKEGVIQMSGSSASAPDLIPKLENSPLLADVKSQGTVFKDAQTGKDRFSFAAKLER